jgi:hypothetical protein
MLAREHFPQHLHLGPENLDGIVVRVRMVAVLVLHQPKVGGITPGVQVRTYLGASGSGQFLQKRGGFWIGGNLVGGQVGRTNAELVEEFLELAEIPRIPEAERFEAVPLVVRLCINRYRGRAWSNETPPLLRARHRRPTPSLSASRPSEPVNDARAPGLPQAGSEGRVEQQTTQNWAASMGTSPGG